MEDIQDRPQFGLVDVIEAFTAMRHEWRGQTRETRDLATSLQTVTSDVEHLQDRLSAQAESQWSDDRRKLAESLAEMDQQLSRAVSAATELESRRRAEHEAVRTRLKHEFQQQNFLTRWFARRTLSLTLEALPTIDSDRFSSSAALEGFGLVLAKLRAAMQQHEIQRIETLGRPFDAETMHAIGTLPDSQFEAGQVAEQLMPAYTWNGRLLQYAQVQVAE